MPFCFPKRPPVVRRERLNTTHQEFFPSADGQPLSYSGLKQIIDRLRRKSGVTRLHPHLFRHTFAVKYLMNGGDLITLQRILGHTTVQVTQMYLHLVDQDVKVQH
jgi:site-specific recombinase XerD